MTRKWPLPQAGVLAAFIALLLSPTGVAAQRATGTLIVRVENAGVPVVGVDVSVLAQRTRRIVGTTGIGGVVAVDQLPIEIASGTRVSTEILECGDEASVLLVPLSEVVVTLPADCARRSVGTFFWGQVERIVVRVDGDQVSIEQLQSKAVTSRLSGLRLSVQGLFTTLSGFDTLGGDSEFGSGFGGDVRVVYLWPSGIGLGGGGSLTLHDVSGVDENMWKWSAFAEPRYTFFLGSSKLRPHVLARVSYNWFSYESTQSGQPGGIDQSGWGFGGGAGIHYPIAGWLGLEMGLYYGALSMAFSGYDESRSGSEFQITAGLRFF